MPGDILKVEFPERSIVCLIAGSVDAGVIAEALEGHPARCYHILYFDSADGFVHCTCMEDYLRKYAERIGHLNWNEVTCGGADIAEVLFENQSLKKQLSAMTQAKEYWHAKADGYLKGDVTNG